MDHVFLKRIPSLFILVFIAEKNELQQGENDEGSVVYHIKHDYKAIFLGMSYG